MTSSFCRLFDVFVDNGSLFRRGIVNSIEVLNFKSSLTFRSLNRTMDSHGDSSDRQSSEQTQPIKRFGWRPLCEIPSGSSTPSRNRQPSTSSRNSVLKTPEKSRIMGMETNNASGLQNQKRTSDSVSNTSGPTPNSKGLRYIAKRDRTVDQSPSVKAYHSPSLVKTQSSVATPTRTRIPASPLAHRTSATYSLHSPSQAMKSLHLQR